MSKEKNKKKKVITRDPKLDISPVSSHQENEKPKEKKNKEDIIIPKEKKNK